MEPTVAERIRVAKEETRKRIREVKGVSREVRRLMLYIADRLFEKKLRATTLRRELKPSKQAEKEFKARLGLTIGRYIKEQRMLARQKLLETTPLDVCEVAAQVPGVSENHVSSNFRRWDADGRTPMELQSAAGRRERSRARDEERRAWLCPQLFVATPEQSRAKRRAVTAQAATPAERRRRFTAATVDAMEEETARLGVESACENGRRRRHSGSFCRTLFDALSERGRQRGREHRQRGVEMARLALAVVEGHAEELGESRAETLALAWARLGNARRLASDFVGAEEALRRAEGWAGEMRREKAGSVRAEIFGYLGSLRLFQRRFSEAETWLREALIESRTAGETRIEIAVLQQRAVLNAYRGHPRAALPDLRAALELTPAEEPRCRLLSVQSLLVNQVLLEDYAAVAALLPEARELASQLEERPGRLQIRWAEGLLARQRGEFEEAENYLKESREGFAELGDAGNKAVASLELALLYEEQGRAPEALEHASEALPALEVLEMPEALGALELLRSALAERKLERTILQNARQCLLRAR